MNMIRDFLDEFLDEWRSIVFLVVSGVFLIFVLGLGDSGFEEESSWIGWIFVAIIIIGIYIYGKLDYLRRLEDIIRYLNDKYKLYRRVETYTFFSGSEPHIDTILKPNSEDEQESWPDNETFQSDYTKAVLSSRKRLRKKLKKTIRFEPLVNRDASRYLKKKIQAELKDAEKRAWLLDKKGGADGKKP